MRIAGFLTTGALFLGGCQSVDRQPYEKALTCVGVADAMMAAAGTVGTSPQTYDGIRATWYSKTLAEGKRIGLNEADVRRDLSDKVEKRLKSLVDESGKPDVSRIKADLQAQLSELKTCPA